MKLLSGILSLTLTSVVALASASAADIYAGPAAGSYKDTPAYVGVNSTGLYVGVNGGYGWSAQSSTIYAFANDAGTTDTSPTTSYDKSGGFGGGQIGYNLQRDRFVFGVEADFQGAGITGSGSAFANADSGDVLATGRREGTLDWFGTVRGRLGYAYDRALIYFTGGFAYGASSGTASIVMDDTKDGGGVHNYSFNPNATRTGYVLGGGVEYALTPAWSVKGEYQFIDLGSSNGFVGYHDLVDGGNLGRGYFTTDQSYNTVRVGLNYHVGQSFEPLK